MAEGIDYHALLREAVKAGATTVGTATVHVLNGTDVYGALEQHDRQARELEEAQRVNKVLNANLQSLGEQVRELRAQLDEQRGDLIAFEITGRAVLSERDIDNLVDRVWAKFDAQRAEEQDGDEDDEDD